MTLPLHQPVMPEEVLAALAVRPGGSYVDGTLGAGGHALRILELSAPDGRLFGLDADPEALAVARERLAPHAGRAVLVHSNFRHIASVAAGHGFVPADGVLLDLGLSSMQLDVWARGFSFRRDQRLDMRFDPTTGPTAAELLRSMSEEELATALWQYGEEPASRRIARAVTRAGGDIETTGQLADLVAQSVGRPRGRTHPATRTFQALRILVNEELQAIEEGLHGALEILRPGGRLVVISFHSLEDRLIKTFMRRESAGCVCPPRQPECTCGHAARLQLVQRKAVKPAATEIESNPRSRSARLRVAERI